MAEVDYSTGKKPRVKDVKAKSKNAQDLALQLIKYLASSENSQRVRWTIEEI
jgi:hypothetical protein